jgi:hypothetical protein
MSTAMSTHLLRYGPVAQGFHWLTVILVATAYLVSPGGSRSACIRSHPISRGTYTKLPVY